MSGRRDPDDLRRLRTADRDRADEESRRPEPVPGGTRRILANTVLIDRYPQTPQAFYGVQAAAITGDEVEGGAGVTTGGIIFLAWNTGTAIPPIGQPVDVTITDYRAYFSWWG